jgi:spore germination cell wall hydrolase CwlJ-like protein
MLLETAMVCLALNVYHEARSEPIDGQIAVAKVTMQRAKWDAKNVCREVFRPAQFSWTTDRAVKVKGGYKLKPSGIPKEKGAWLVAWNIARAALGNNLPAVGVRGATHYHTVDVRPVWSRKMVVVARIGRHIFYRVA